MNDRYTELLDTADRIAATDLYPARLRIIISDLAAALREIAAANPAALRVTGPNSDGEYWLHIKAEDRNGGINLGAVHGPICKRLLDAVTETHHGS